MIKKLLIIPFLLLTLRAEAATVSYKYYSGPLPTASATSYMIPEGGSTGSSTTNTSRYYVLPAAGAITNLSVSTTAAPGSSKSWTFAVYIGGAAKTVTCAIANAATSCTDDAHSDAVSAGDLMNIRLVTAGTTNAANVRWSFKFSSTTQGQTYLSGGTGATALDGTTTEYLSLGQAGSSDVEANFQHIMPTAGTIKNLYVAQTTANGGGNSRVYTVRKNGVATAVTCTIGNATSCNDTTHTVDFVAGDLISLEEVPDSNPTASKVQHGFVVVTATDGDFIQIGSDQGDESSSSDVDYNISGYPSADLLNITSGNVWMKSQYIQLLTAAPGAGTSKIFTFVKAGTPTALATTISNASTSGSTTETVAVTTSDTMQINLNETGSPAAAGFNVSYLMTSVDPTVSRKRVF